MNRRRERERLEALGEQVRELSTDVLGWRRWVAELAEVICDTQTDPILQAGDMVRRAQLAQAMKGHDVRARDRALAELVRELTAPRQAHARPRALARGATDDRYWAALAEVARHALSADSLLARAVAGELVRELIDREQPNPTKGTT